jgi:hypothetical protein
VIAPVHDLHLHPGPSRAPRWGDGRRVWEAAREAGVRAFVWKAHEQHSVAWCKELPSDPVRAIGSASINPWASFENVTQAIEEGALWVWGSTMTPDMEIGWDLPLPPWWPRLAEWLADRDHPVVLGTGHLGAEGRAAFAELAERSAHVCSITHSLYLSPEEARDRVAQGCALEIDAFTYSHDLGRPRSDLPALVHEAVGAGATVYFTSDGGQATTGNPFEMGRDVLARIEPLLGEELTRTIALDGPAKMLAAVGVESEVAR